jgi:drug/metabolite transporter (DMT)-like permease
MTQQRDLQLAKLAVAYSGLAWGLYWLPLRALETAGLSQAQALIVFQAVPVVFALPALAFRFRRVAANWRILGLLGAAAALPMAVYAAALLHTDILRAMVLFYLMPVWSTLLERLVSGVRVTPLRLLAIGFAALAIAIMFGAETDLPLPRNAGDWLALTAGAMWSVASLILHRLPWQPALDVTTAYFLVSALAALGLLALAGVPMPTALVAAQLGWLVPATGLIVVTSVYASMWGVPRISPGLSGLLYMTEIAAGAVSAALWAGEPFGPRQAAGVLLIAVAGSLDSLADLLRAKRR